MSAKKVNIFVLASLAVLGGLAACNYIGDDNGCVVGYNANTPQKDCRFGPPVLNGGTPGGGCTPLEVDTAGTECNGVTWKAAVWPALRGSCAVSTCHDNGNGSGSAQPYLPSADAAASFKALEGRSYDCGSYVSSSDPGSSQILNNLAGKAGAGTKMPIGRTLDAAVIATITTWVKCGAPQ